MSDAAPPNRPSSNQPAIYRHSGLLGTVIELRVGANANIGDLADTCNESVVAEIERLQSIFSAYDPTSELHRWRTGTATTSSSEFAALMALTLEWHHRSGGRFNPMAGELTARWQQAEREDQVPGDAELADIVGGISQPRFAMVDGQPVPTGDCTTLNLNAIAKGFIVDRALRVAAPSLAHLDRWSISINAGGDLAHLGSSSMRVGIENPHRPYDNEPPVTTVALTNAALATSGVARRGFRVAGCWFGHVIDPLTGWPVDDIASISVIAPDATTADVLATAAGVRTPRSAVEFIDELADVEALVIDRDREQHRSRGWSALEVP